MRTRGVTLLVIAGLGSGCAVPPRSNGLPHGQPAVAAAGGIECHLQHVTGELIAVRVCTMKEQRDAIKQSTQDARDFLDRQSVVCPGTPGCRN